MAIRIIASLGFILAQSLLYANESAGSFRIATQALSIMQLRIGVFERFVILPTFSVSPDELVVGTSPTNEHKLSKFLNLLISSNSVIIVSEVINPIPGMVRKSLIRFE